jgi:hypothetical protein
LATLEVHRSLICGCGISISGWLRAPQHHHDQHFVGQFFEQFLWQFDDA